MGHAHPAHCDKLSAPEVKTPRKGQASSPREVLSRAGRTDGPGRAGRTAQGGLGVPRGVPVQGARTGTLRGAAGRAPAELGQGRWGLAPHPCPPDDALLGGVVQRHEELRLLPDVADEVAHAEVEAVGRRGRPAGAAAQRALLRALRPRDGSAPWRRPAAQHSHTGGSGLWARGSACRGSAGSHRLLLDALRDGLRSPPVRLEQADDAGTVGVQDVFVLVPHHQVQRQDPVGDGTGEAGAGDTGLCTWGDPPAQVQAGMGPEGAGQTPVGPSRALARGRSPVPPRACCQQLLARWLSQSPALTVPCHHRTASKHTGDTGCPRDTQPG